MAEGSVNSPVTPERTMPNGNNLRRNSTGKVSSSNTGESILPHYLRASTGSCHDFCKYGRKHAFEEKERRSMLKRVVKKSFDSRNPVVTVALPRRKETLVIKLKPSHESQSYTSDTPWTIKHEASKQSLESQNPAERDVLVERKKKSGVEIKSSSYSKAPSHESKSYSCDTPQTIKREVSKQSPDSQNQAESKLLVERKKKSGVKFKSSPSSKTHISHNPKTMKQEVSSTEKVKVFSRKGSAKAKDLNLSMKHATSLKPQSLTAMPRSFPNSTGGKSGQRNGDVKTGKMTGTFRVAAKKVLAPPPASLPSKSSVNKVANVNERNHRDLKIVSPYTNNNIRKAEPKQHDEVQEKTLYVIKMETENKPLESDQNESHAIELLPAASSPPKFLSLPNAQSSSSHEEDCEEESEYTMSEAEDELPSESNETEHIEEAEEDCEEESEYTMSEAEDELPSESNETEHIEEAETVEERYNGRPRKAGMVCSEDKKGQALKLKFRRGKVVDSQSLTNSPRRLKFKRGKVLGENQNVKAVVRRRSFKRPEVDSDTYGIEPDPQKVVLRHQDVQGKRDAQGLFNNVIEETASKLAETRKSKVKALVGAFETVISLQEKKPSANTVT
ncbi:hypothetical protein I3760_04G058500 [Carya illinoinensis]|uniref:Calmodulin-binding domain-containing protein n=1 Tax=Carya illinoinensis TaxID=32201 RepID=A0A922FB10_CARIL|nr:hypothetical protein I3760_04G058500 [Carya illinoinensis]KAG2711034.1 hypothetical protein I3760_04G058500 [Carya illinoinensis]KAG2711035.1 hypothetical protein I3760_04G058500 [Carya illinoinensis]KAG2711036.1 hypothetical protein I3760_04G058500 [Carya illinoinensis]KAG2711037.1 hypothetical protein I3760_04G058500 [Carya illinoinensis]